MAARGQRGFLRRAELGGDEARVSGMAVGMAVVQYRLLKPRNLQAVEAGE